MKVFLKYILFITAMFSCSNMFAQIKTWTLKECIDQAVGKNIQLNETQLTSKLNEISYDQTKANRYPDFSFTDGQAFNFGYSINPVTDLSSKQNISSNNASLNGSITLYNGFQLKNSIKQSKFLLDAGNFDVDKMKNDITLNVVADYLQVIYSYKALDIAKEQVSGTLTQVDRTQKFVDAGKLAEGNLLQIQSQLATDKASIVSAENQLQLAKVNLQQLMNMPIVDNFEVDSAGIKEPSVEYISTTADIYTTSEKIMPEIKSADLKTQADETGIKIAQALSLPKLSLGGALKTGYSSGSSLYSSTTTIQDIGYLQSNPTEQVLSLVPVTNKMNYPFSKQIGDNFGEAISLSLTVPIFNNYQAKYGVAKAKIVLENSQLVEQSVKDQLRKSIEQAYTDLTAASKDYAAALDILKSEQRSYSDLEKKFNLGLATATDFLIEKNNYEKAQQTVIQSKFNYIFKSKIIDFYLGKPLN
jgi:outer membrane protein